MVMEPPAPPAPQALPPKSETAFWWARLSTVQVEKAIDNVATKAAKYFRRAMEVHEEALHLRKLPPDQRLLSYRQRLDTAWYALEQMFPEHYKENILDWEALEAKVLAGDMVDPELELESIDGEFTVLEDPNALPPPAYTG